MTCSGDASPRWRLQSASTPAERITPLADAYYRPAEVTDEHRSATSEVIESYVARLRALGIADRARAEAMNRVNPKYVLRNYLPSWRSTEPPRAVPRPLANCSTSCAAPTTNSPIEGPTRRCVRTGRAPESAAASSPAALSTPISRSRDGLKLLVRGNF